MWLASMLARWLAARLPGAAALPDLARPFAARLAQRPLRWRAPWVAWQMLSWVALTLLAPPFWTIGTLLLINPSSDQPFFWAAAMAIVPVANGVAIVATNQRHHRAPFLRRTTVAVHAFAVATAVGGALFVLLLWQSHAIAGLVGPLAASADATRRAPLALWVAGLAAAFGVASSAHASIVHAWLAFED
ncbi:hypothetical protein WJ32_27840 [Burkholderia ubonensis]|uniref:Uncharacterized protein n=1 Tax=Burkholderia ubonensis TaxID=101571 RepID=A0A124RE99_9BURK|nr:hypothetical protein [Burkholderia ubonensis]AOJ66207.1 hypothetical protein WJ32_27840 [Burkholderia ubonensis]KVG76506.1 hypothetical protein WJ33_12450 [Burkholderia ubonensis]